jgi:uncharacterized protein YjbI with pentapeptide repeats
MGRIGKAEPDRRMGKPVETLIGWLDLGWLRRARQRRWVGRLTGLLLVGAAILVAILLAGLLIDFACAVFGSDPDGAATRNIGLVLAAAIGLPFLIWRSWVAQRLADTGAEGLVTDRINAAVASLGAQKTVKDTGAEGGEGTEDNIEVRVGAILALERIARQNLAFHIQIMEILCAYIRINAPVEQAKPKEKNAPAEKAEPAEKNASAEKEKHPPPLQAYPWIGPGEYAPEIWEKWRKDVQTGYRDFAASRRPRLDIQTALTVLGRRGADQRKQEARGPSGGGDEVFPFDAPYPKPPAYPKTYSAKTHAAWEKDFARFEKESDARNEAYRAYTGYRLDLRYTNLQGYDLSGGCWRGARFDGARMQGARILHAQMRGAELRESRMQGAHLYEAQMQGADLYEAQMQGAILGGAKIQEAVLWGAGMEGASLLGAQLHGAELGRAKMQGAELAVARMQGAALSSAQMQGADLWGAGMEGASLIGTKFDAKTRFRPASLHGAALRGVDLSGVAFDAAILDGSFGDGSVTLPEGMKRPAGWAAEVLDNAAFAERLAAHRAALNGTPDK